MKRFLLVCIAILVCTFSLNADFPNGFAEDGYTYYNGYWYGSSGQQYTRIRVDGGYYRYGYFYPTYYYKYTPYVVPQIKYIDTNWRNKLLDLTQQRIEQQNYMEAIKALGLTQNNLLYPSQYNYSQYGVNANTVYGYTYSNVASLYGDTDLNSLFQQSAQLVQNAQSLAGEAHTQFQASIDNEGKRRAEIAQILARGEMAQRIITSLTGPSTVETHQFTFSVNKDGTIQPHSNNVPLETKDAIYQQWSQLATNACMKCHSGANKKGNFDISVYPSLNAQQRNVVLARLTTTDESKRMPKQGKPLTQEELKLFVLVENQKNKSKNPIP